MGADQERENTSRQEDNQQQQQDDLTKRPLGDEEVSDPGDKLKERDRQIEIEKQQRDQRG
ncbi:hypothetical protein [Paracoccus laeviglucosivorans]|uniref:Uncharacterized protein n=1 Tax=Paracoccus laeviglucosivorans TaxID=1197861 RepID=A0A521FN27_9RHOB|nr:hypothetical protein [Paracoccus laeviglucosivorans]SMO97615.1 hypothetical protein SAMN06265221_12837 [Paracoccus laeviglucosivorans]